MNQNYQRALDIGIENMNFFPTYSKEYQLAQKLVAWACERNRQEQKVELIPPPEIGSLEEKIKFDSEQPNYYL